MPHTPHRRSNAGIPVLLLLLAAFTLNASVAGCGLVAGAGVKDPVPRPKMPRSKPDPVEDIQKTDNPVTPPAPVSKANNLLGATNWFQTSAEYYANARGAYQSARAQLDRALAEKSWTAATEQVTTLDFADKPPAIIVDVDETVLDNSPYQARLIRDKATYPAGWDIWCNEKKARPIPGAVEFLRYAAEKGVTVFYVTNRDAAVEPATRANLEAHGFPVKADEDVILTKNQSPEWSTSDKSARRAFVAQKYRIVLMFGDNLGDFVGAENKGTVEVRQQVTTKYNDWWGSRWIMLSNPLYGDWDGTLFNFDYKLSADAQDDARLKALRTD